MVETQSIQQTQREYWGPVSRYIVNLHRYRQDCWVIIDRNIYEVTQYLKEHPKRAQQIMQYAGKDATLGLSHIRQEIAREDNRVGVLSKDPNHKLIYLMSVVLAVVGAMVCINY